MIWISVGDGMTKKQAKIFLIIIGFLILSLVVAMSFQNFRNWLCFHSGTQICIFETQKSDKDPKIWKHYSQQEWDALPSRLQDEIMGKRMESDTRTFSNFKKGSEEHRKFLEYRDQQRRKAIQRAHNPNLETE